MSDKSTDTQAEQVVMEALSKCGGGGINPEIYPVLWSKRHHNMWCLQCWPPHMKGRVSV